MREISEADARAEGFPEPGWNNFLDYWDMLHGNGATDHNHWVIALTFTVHKQNIDDFLRQRERAA